MAAVKTLAFVPFEHKRTISPGKTAKHVVMGPRSPSPQPHVIVAGRAPLTPSAAAPAHTSQSNSNSSTPAAVPAHSHVPINRSLPSPASSTSALASLSSSPLTPRQSRLDTSSTRQPPSSSATSVLSPPPSPPSRKGKERERQVPVSATKLKALIAAQAPPVVPVARVPNDRPLSAGDIDLSWPEPIASARRRAAGLQNDSMACYVNATLQVLLHTPPVLRVALEHTASDCLFKSRNTFCMLCALRELAVNDHWAGKKSWYRPIPIHGQLSKIKKGFSKHRQEDTHEFFRFVTDALQNSALAGLPKDLPEKIKHTSWVYRTWGGQVRSRVLCLTCKKPSDTFDSFLDLSLDISQRMQNISDLFSGFVREDRLDGDNKYHCDNCKKKSVATKSMRIAEAPPVLTLHLKRFGMSLTSWTGKMTKMNVAIEYPAALDIAPYMTPEAASTTNTRYRLFAVTCHLGSSLHYGHYKSYVRGPDGAWYQADDEDMTPVKIGTVLHDRSAYLLSYIRISGDGKGPASTPSTTPSRPVAETVQESSSKRLREDDESSPMATAKRFIGPQRPPVDSPVKLVPRVNGHASTPASGNDGASAAKGASGNDSTNGEPPALQRLSKQYDSDSESDAGKSAPSTPLPAPVPVRATVTSPMYRPSHPSPFKSKHHRVNHKHAAVGSGSGGGRHGNGGSGGGLGAPMPFSVGQKRSANARFDKGRKKGMLKAMRGRP